MTAGKTVNAAARVMRQELHGTSNLNPVMVFKLEFSSESPAGILDLTPRASDSVGQGGGVQEPSFLLPFLVIRSENN